jgi:hypothetical protein
VNEWENVDRRVLEWVATTRRVSPVERYWYELFARDDWPFDDEPLADLSGKQVDEALRRLLDDNRIDGKRAAFIGRELRTRWTNLRVTAGGLNALGEWLDLDRVATAVGVQNLLLDLAERETDPERRSLLQRAAGAAVLFANETVRGALASVVASEVGEVLEP